MTEAGPTRGRRLRLAVYTDATSIGGAEEVLGHLVGALRSSIDVAVVGSDADVVAAVAARRPGSAVRLVPAVRDKWDVRGVAGHVRVLLGLRPDVVQANLRTPWTCQYGILAGLLVPRARVIAVEHLPIPSGDPGQRRLKRVLAGRLAAHVAVGGQAARLVEEYAGLPVGSIRTVHNGVPDVRLEPVPRPLPGLVVGSLGRLDTQKGYDVLLRALAGLEGVSAVLVGDGPEREPLEALAAELGLAERLVITGWRSDARAYLGAVDVFCLPSRYEGFPLAILEAMLGGLPVVATRVGSVAEAVLEGETGLLVAAEDPEALREALRRALDPETGRRLGEAGRRRALERFSVEAMAHGYESLYDEAVLRR